jgi:hypothetical protein
VSSVVTGTGLDPVIMEEIAQAEGLLADILVDFWVTDAELEQAFWAAVSCMEAAGVEVRADIDWPARSFNVGFGPFLTPEADLAAQAIVAECQATNFDLALRVSGRQNRLSEQEYVDLFRRIAECLRERGFPVPFDTAESVFEATADGEAALAYGECYLALVGR